MAAELTVSLAREKLHKLPVVTKVKDRILRGTITEFQGILKRLEDDDQESSLKTEESDIEALGVVYQAEDAIDAFLAFTTLQKQKVFPSILSESEHGQAGLKRQLRVVIENLKKFKPGIPSSDPTEDIPDQSWKSEHVDDGNAESNVSALFVDDVKVPPQNLTSSVPLLESKRFGEGASKSNFPKEGDTSDLDDTAKTERGNVKPMFSSSNSGEDIKVQPWESQHVVDAEAEADFSGIVDDVMKVPPRYLPSNLEDMQVPQWGNNDPFGNGEGASRSKFSDKEDIFYLNDAGKTEAGKVISRVLSNNSWEDTKVQPWESEEIVDRKGEVVEVSGIVDDDMKTTQHYLSSNLEDLQVPRFENKNSGDGASKLDFADEDETAKKLAKLILYEYLSNFYFSEAYRPGSSYKMGPLWKTYCSIKGQFDCCAWIHVSEERKTADYVMEQLTGVKQEKDLPSMVQQGGLSRFLGTKKYLLVLYNLHTPKFWKSLPSIVPNSDGSRMILCFREIDAASEIPKARFLGSISGTEIVIPSPCRKDDCPYLDAGRDIVGMRDEIEELHKLICRQYHLHFMILVVGAAGSGKTTLVKAIYNHSHIKQNFEKRAWVSVSKVFEERNLLVQILKEVTEVKDEEKLSLEELRKKIRTLFVGQRYLVVLDDVQTTYAWEKPKAIFPISFLSGSRVVLTIRDHNVAQNIDPSIYYTHKLRPLNDKDSWKLFLDVIKVEKRLNDSDLSNIKQKILQKCRGRPLAIRMLGGKLSIREPKFDEWLKAIESNQQQRTEEERLSEHITQEERVSEHTKQGEKEGKRLRGLARREKVKKRVSEHTQRGEIEEEKVVKKEKRASENNNRGEIEEEVVAEEEKMAGPAQLGEIEEIKVVEKGKMVSKNTQLGDIEEEEEVEGKQGSSEHTEQEVIEEEKMVEEEAKRASREIGEEESTGDSDISASDYIQDLPSPLRAFLSYSCLFPRTKTILVRRLAQLWIAEELVKTSENKEAEDLVDEYLDQLRQRKLIDVETLRSDGKPKEFRVAGLVYDFLSQYAKCMGYFHIHPNSDDKCELSPNLSIRRLAEQLDIEKSELSNDQAALIRSYISFNRGMGDKPADAVGMFLKKTIMKRGFGLLTLLDLEGVYKPVLLPETLRKLPLLRYLGLRWTFLDEIPKIVGDIPYLETLDVKHTNITALPNSICNSQLLRHLYMNRIDFEAPIDKPFPSGSLTNLKTLSGLSIGNGSPTIKWLKKLNGLRKLRLTCYKNSFSETSTWLSEQTSLRSLQLRSLDDDGKLSELPPISMGKLRNLKELYLVGKLAKRHQASTDEDPLTDEIHISTDEVPSTDKVPILPPTLEVFTLSVSRLSKDPMPILGQLKHLKVLRLLANSYVGPDMNCRAGGFPELQVLKLWMLLQLKDWTIEGGAMSQLRSLELRCCPNLQKPDELQKMTKLEELILTRMKERFVDEVKRSIDNKIITENNWEFNPRWDLNEEQQQEIQQSGEQRDGATPSTTDSPRKGRTKKLPSRQLSRLLSGVR